MTINDIAKLAGVSPSTVSKVINKKADEISAQTIQKVMQVVKENNFVTYQKIRQSVKNNKIIAVFIPDIMNSFFSELVMHLENMASQYNYSLIVCNTNEDQEKEEKYLHRMLEQNVDGILVTATSKSDITLFQKYFKQGLNIVFFDRLSGETRIPQVSSDNTKGGYLATKHLLENGHLKIGTITGPFSNNNTQDRLTGYKKALAEYSVAYSDQLVYEGNFKSDSGEKGTKELLKQGVSAIFAQNDLIAFGIYRYLSRKSFKVYEDVSIIGFDNIYFSDIVYPSLTTINQPLKEMTEAAVKLMLSSINKESTENVIVEPSLVERKSVKNMYNNHSDIEKKIMVVGSLNMDILLRVKSIPKPGETILSSGLTLSPGGKGANQAVAAKKLSAKTYMIGRVGEDDYGRELVANLKMMGVDTTGIVFDSNHPTGNAYINISDDGENNIIVHSGANLYLESEQLKQFEYLFDEVEYCLCQFEIPPETIKTVIKICNKKKIKVILNPAPAINVNLADFSSVYMLVPNENELEALVSGSGDIEDKLRELQTLGFKNILVTLGEQGSILLAENGKITRFEAHKGFDVVDTTGAGDTFIGALAAGLSNNKSLNEAIEYASVVAAITVSRPGAQVSIPTKADVDMYLNG